MEKALVATGFPYAIREEIRPIMANLERVLVASQGVRRMGGGPPWTWPTWPAAAWTRSTFLPQPLGRGGAGGLLVEEGRRHNHGLRGPALRLGMKYILASNGGCTARVSELLEE
jgi:myo-inositol-1(or 4)-monophosphatase